MKLTNLVMALATFATITLSTSAYIATQDVTSAVIVDKAKHSLDLTTNGLHHISISEAYIIDRSEAAQINFLRCSFSRPEFRFSWFCHQLKEDGKMTKQSYLALKIDQDKYFKENVLKSIIYESRKWMLLGKQMSVGLEHKPSETSTKEVLNETKFLDQYNQYAQLANKIQHFNERYKASLQYGVMQDVEKGGRELSKAGTETVIRKNISDAHAVATYPLTEIDRVSIQ
ncbi:TPA: hypothetical protein NIE69_002123 [Pseudomonas aeruginosa]|nr:hypothetical protein [Pseudomonas aeruginosa]